MKAVLFDLDGTLIDSSEGVTRSAQYALKHYGVEEPDLNRLRMFIGPPLYYSFTKFYGFSSEQAREAVGVYRERYNVKGIYECSLYPGVKECILQLKQQGYLIGLASSKPEKSCKIILDHFQILELFDEVVGGTFDGKIETKEDVIQELFRRWKEIPKEEMVLVGDTIFDVNGAKNTGITSIAVSFGFGDNQEMMEAGAKALCGSMAEIPEVIAAL